MNIEQAKALKVGDDIILINGDWEDMTVGKTYPVSGVVEGRYVNFTDDIGSTRCCAIVALHDSFDLPTKATNTQWIPFDKERMSEAVEYRLSDTKEYVTELKLYDSKDSVNVAGLVNGYILTVQSEYVEMLVPVVVKYPCFCRSVAKPKLVQLWDCESLGWTPLTTAELAEIGLKQIS